MLGSLTVILVCQLLGEILTKATKLPVPGPVIGMVILFCGLVFCHNSLPDDIEQTGGGLLRYLALLFVPAGVGVVTNMDLVIKSWAPIVGALTVGTFVTIGMTGFVMQLINRRQGTVTEKEQQ